MKFVFLGVLVISSLWSETLSGLIAYANKHSTTLQQTQTQLELAQLNRASSRASQFGELNVVGDYNHYNIERTLAPLVPSSLSGGAPVVTSKDIFSAGLKYTVPLFTGFAQTRQVEIDQIATQMSQAKMKLSQEQLVYNIRSLYLGVLTQKEILKAQKKYTHALKKLSKQISYEVRLGKKSEVDKLKTEADLEMAKTQESLLVSNIETTKATLGALVGRSIGELKPLHIKIAKPHYSLKALYAKASRLSKVALEEMALKKADKRIAKSKSASLPQVNLAAYAGKNYGEDLATNNWENETLWQVGVNVNYNLIDFGKRDIAIQKAKIAKMQAGFTKEQTLRDLKKLLAQAIEQVKQSYATYLGNKAQLRLSQKAQNIEQVRYENDASTLNDLLLAKGKVWLAQAKVIEAKYAYQKGKYTIEYLMEQGVR